MNIIRKRSLWTVLGAGWALLSGLPAAADDTELFVASPGQQAAAQPNILFIMDTSGSMSAEVRTQATYDPNVDYAGACRDDRIYWRTDTGNPPDCDTTRYVDLNRFTCDAAMQAFASGTGRYTDRMAQFDPGRDDRWERLSSGRNTRYVECEDDAGIHGQVGADPETYAQSGDQNAMWTANSNNAVTWGQNPTDRLYTVYEGNYINWFYGPTAVSTRIQVVKDVATDLLNTVNGVNVGLMRFNFDDGGPVIHAMENIATARPVMSQTINNLPANGWTPLAETLYEAGLYYMGRPVDYGLAGPNPSVPASREAGNQANYDSPIELSCQKNFVVLLTDGEPTQDLGATAKVPLLPGFLGATGLPVCDGLGDGACLDDMAAYLYGADLSPLPGEQNVITYTIGFTIDLPILEKTAQRGGGEYFRASDTASLSTALTNIITQILETQTTFTAPSVSVNSFNRTRNLNDLFISVFQASGDVHWPGNLKKYRLRAADGEIVDVNDTPAVDPATGFFADTAQSYWSAGVDGSDVELGGAANRIPDPANRNVYTYLGDPNLTAAASRVETANNAIDDAALGIGQPGDPMRDELIDFIRGVDVTDIDQDNDRAEARNQMGDPLHAQPISVIYGGTLANPDINDALIYFATNDGVLHAIDPLTGIEQWSFIPPEFLQEQVDLYRNDASVSKHYGIDGSLRVQTLANNDGVIDAAGGEKVYLFVGMRRGGNFYYGLDVTNPAAPRLMWRHDGNSLPGIGQSWSNPVPTRVSVNGVAQNADNLALVIGGGYDTSQDNLAGSTDNAGNAIFIVDSETGNLLWHASDAGANLNLADMQYSIPGDIKVLDINGDQLADRMYAGDMGGQVWRFDIYNGQNANGLVTGGVIAQLGGAPQGAPPQADTRRFYYAPDVALVDDGESTFLHIGVGSGQRARPNSIAAQDRFYALRDYTPFVAHPQAYYDALAPITDGALQDITDDVNAVVAPGSAGWRFELRDGGWRGEKVLAEARTFNNQIFFTTFTPGAGGLGNGCQPSLGMTRLYVMDLVTGAPVNNLDESADPTVLTEEDRYREFRGSISSEVVFLFPSPDDPNCVGDQCTPPPVACVDLFCFPPGFANNPIRTFWSQESTP